MARIIHKVPHKVNSKHQHILAHLMSPSKFASHSSHSVIGLGHFRYIMRQHPIYSILYS